MLSGNGRHRRPRQAPALVVAAGVTGSAIAIPLLGATGAHAADGTNWDRVAECETGGAWSQNSGNGYYGGLQLSQDIWEQYGGLGYASSADQASRSQQIAVAEKVLAAQGIAAWPTCGLLAGLGNDSGILSGGTATPGDGASAGESGSGTSGTSGSSGLTDSSESVPESSPSATPSPSQSPSRPSSPSASATADAASGSADETTKSDTSTPSGTPAGDDAQASGGTGATAPGGDESDKSGQSGAASGSAGTEESTAGRHRGGSAEEGAVDGRTAESSGRHASRGESGDRGLTDGSYTVRSGDSLWGIADSLDLTGGWHTLYADNKDVVGADPDHILPGQTLTVGGEPVENQG
ncbi:MULTISPECIES: LysM peptidoglycan-binding domain-containing protein [Streptomyces]|uniref:LysM peptidoglycan-binding domain-containing protein n=1 Tax=Streptomyces TaxID=1883 RepID=UPI001EFC13E6|nr:transglycosylase family protein [Streptomyces sp. CL12-4]MCG8967119.1 LysM peptidoglycan-binding domain-containing protein [Streptomyces sp. CL12-4]